MSKPVILTLDDDPNVLQAVARDLRSRFGSEYKITRADSGESALELLSALRERGDRAALLVVDQRMPKMSGVDFLEKAVQIYPDARRVLLTAYADTDAAIKAINDVQVDYYLLKPWAPPEEKLYPVLEDLLEEWKVTHPPPFEGIRLIGSQWSPAVHEIKEFLARNHVPYLWLDPETSEEAQELVAVAATADFQLPCLIFPDGTVLQRPDSRQIAEKVGMKTIADQPFYDLIVIGAGPAGLAAAVYGASEGLRTLVVEQQAPGGQAGMSSRIENYLGFPGGLSGGELAHRAVSQAKRFGVEILTAREVVGLRASGPSRIVELRDGSTVECRAVIIATGVSYRKLDAPGVVDLTGAGVYYGAAMTEGESVKGKQVHIVGGANSAGQAAMYFSRYASEVTILVRGTSLSASMSRYLIDQIESTENISVWTQSTVEQAIGTDRLKQLVINRNGANETAVTAGLFIFIGARPRTDWLGEAVARDEHGFILAGNDVRDKGVVALLGPEDRLPYLLETSLSGVFVAGDVRSGSMKRVASAVGEGAMAVSFVHRYLAES
jgi:thioredoxin reductase (NADPH)